MAVPRYRAAAAEALRIAHLDDFIAIYHRPSGLTHLVTAPVPELLALLGEAALDRDTLLARLIATFDLGDADADALDARLGELVQIGLVERL